MQGEPIECPYKEVCKCPGGEAWLPIKGCILAENGVHCLDWDVTILLENIPSIRTPEGRSRRTIEAADKLDQAAKKYNKSTKRREAQKRYEGKDKGRITREKHQDSEKFRLSQQKYYYSDKGQEAHERRNEILRDFRQVEKWLREHPGKTYEDYIKEA